MIEISHLTKKYAANVAVYDLNLTLEPGHIYGFLGPNGAGKSTTMNIITGYIGASSGEVKVNGYDINKEPEKAKACIGYLPEQPPLYGDMKVREYLKFAAGLKNIKKEDTDEAIRQVINKTKLYQVENRLIRNLSKGFRQRVGLAQALLGSPEIIIMDEPTVGLDPKQIIEIRSLIKSLKKDHTVVLSSHIMQEISAVCDHVFIINNGKIVANDTMENLETTMSGAQRVEVTIFGQNADAELLADVPGAEACRIIADADEEEAPQEQAEETAAEEEAAKEDAFEEALAEEALAAGREMEAEEAAAEEAASEETAAEETASEEAESEEAAAEEAASEEAAAEEAEAESEEAESEEAESEEAESEETESEETESGEIAAEESEESVEAPAKAEAEGAAKTVQLTEAVSEEVAETEDAETAEAEDAEAAEEADEEEADEAGPVPDEPREIRVVLTAEEDADIREQVFRYCVEHELTLLGLKTLSRTLEDVYLELTEGRRERAI